MSCIVTECQPAGNTAVGANAFFLNQYHTREHEKMQWFGFWDWTLIAVVTAMSVGVAYFYHPRAKALILSLPLPATLAMLSLQQNVDASNILGLSLLLVFTHLVRVLYQRKRMAIIPAILTAVAVYCLAAVALRHVYPVGETWFLAALAWNFALAAWMLWRFPARAEEGQKSPMPVWLKLIVILGVVTALVVMKQWLGGFMTVFPMVGVITAYEGRKALWSIARQIAVMMITLGVMFTVIHYLFSAVGLYFSLAAGWVVMLALLIPIHRRVWRGIETSGR